MTDTVITLLINIGLGLQPITPLEKTVASTIMLEIKLIEKNEIGDYNLTDKGKERLKELRGIGCPELKAM